MSETYVSYVANTFLFFVNPGLNPTYQATASSCTIREVNRKHIICWVHYETYHAADKALHKLLLDTVPEIYLDAITHDTLDFGKCTSLDIIYHLWDTYGTIDDDQLAANLEMIKHPWQPPTPTEKLFTQLKTCQAFSVLGNDTITDASKIRMGVALIKATSFFSQA